MTTDNAIRIYCADPGAFHEKRGRTEVAAMQRRAATEPDGTVGWFEVEYRRGKAEPKKFALKINPHHRPVSEALLTADGEVLPAGARRSVAYDRERTRAARWDLDRARSRYSFRCPCGLNVPVRGETLWPILDRLDAESIPEIGLHALRRLVA